MKRMLIFFGILIGCIIIVIVGLILATPAMDRWGTNDAEVNAVYPGDELLTNPGRVSTRAITVKAEPEKIYPWIVQTGADKSGMYSYTWLENLMGCKMAKDETIHPEWQNLKVGDLMKMCASDPAPTPYAVAEVIPNEAVIYGHQENGAWVDLWQFILVPQKDGSTRLISRTRTNMTGGIWEVIRPISFFMEQKMLSTIKTLAEK